MPAGDRRHRKEAGRSDPADPVRRLQRDGRRIRARLAAFHVRARMNPMTSKKNDRSCRTRNPGALFFFPNSRTGKSRLLSGRSPESRPGYADRTMHPRHRRFRPARAERTTQTARVRLRKSLRACRKRNGIRPRRPTKGSFFTDEPFLRIYRNRYGRDNRPPPSANSKPNMPSLAQTRRRRMNTRNDRICLNPNEYYTKTTI